MNPFDDLYFSTGVDSFAASHDFKKHVLNYLKNAFESYIRYFSR